jgi:hypothetical protein
MVDEPPHPKMEIAGPPTDCALSMVIRCANSGGLRSSKAVIGVGRYEQGSALVDNQKKWLNGMVRRLGGHWQGKSKSKLSSAQHEFEG